MMLLNLVLFNCDSTFQSLTTMIFYSSPTLRPQISTTMQISKHVYTPRTQNQKLLILVAQLFSDVMWALQLRKAVCMLQFCFFAVKIISLTLRSYKLLKDCALPSRIIMCVCVRGVLFLPDDLIYIAINKTYHCLFFFPNSKIWQEKLCLSLWRSEVKVNY